MFRRAPMQTRSKFAPDTNASADPALPHQANPRSAMVGTILPLVLVSLGRL
jgi:hypothetical protein